LDAQSISDKAKRLLFELTSAIQTTDDAARLEELLDVNDELLSSLARIPSPGRPILKLQGLGSNWDADRNKSDDAKANGGTSTSILVNGEAQHDSPEEEGALTPKIDKGKAKAEPEPEQQEKVLSPNFLITESEDEEDGTRSPVELEEVDLPSSTDR
jgi:protein phosphatase 1 regulatory subunit 37